MARKRVEAQYAGRVQGVGFRFTAERFANAYKAKGYVRNMPDGGVELVAEGEEEEVRSFLEALHLDMANYISRKNLNWFPATGEFRRFEIRFY